MVLTPTQLSQRWGMAIGTLRNWRSQGKGPAFVRLGSATRARVIYRLRDVEEYEKKHLHQVKDVYE